MSFEIPAWIRESMSDTEVQALEELAARAQIGNVKSRIEDLDRVVVEVQRNAEDLDVVMTIEAVKTVQELAKQILEVLQPAEVTKSTAPKPKPEMNSSKQRNNAVWYYVRNNLDRLGANKYVDPGDLRRRDPDAYDQLKAEGARLYDEGRLTASGKLV